MARGTANERPIDRLEENLCRLRGLAAAVGCIGVAIEGESGACLRPDYALQILATIAHEEAELAEKEVEELWRRTAAGEGRADG